MENPGSSLFDWRARTALLAVVALSFLTYVHNFQRPQAFFWDENYHIASAQKYLNGVFFMEPHPPLGKLLIALGEKLINANTLDNQFIDTDYATNPPKDFVFAGYRLFPVLFAWWVAPILFIIFLYITRHPLWSVLLTFPYIFDTALIVHSRGAMLDGIMLFFIASTILGFILVREWKMDRKKFRWASILFGAAFGLLMVTKVFGLILILLVPAVAVMLWPDRRKFWSFLWPAFLAFCVAYLGVWMLHFHLARTVVPQLPDKGYYQSMNGKAYIDEGTSTSLRAFPTMLHEALAFVSHYEKGVPRMDLCKADENGSPAFLWPFGGRTISYRWETQDHYSYSYLYLVANPVAWGMGLLGIALAALMLVAPLLVPGAAYTKRSFLMLVFLGIYVAYMIAVLRIDRVMYLYHYFVPLFISFLLCGICLTDLPQLGKWRLLEDRRSMLFLGLGAAVFMGFLVYRPFAYYEPMSDDAVMRRELLGIWDLRCVNCEQDSYFAVPSKP